MRTSRIWRRCSTRACSGAWGAVADEHKREPMPEEFGELAAPFEAVMDESFLAGAGRGRTNGLDWAIEFALERDHSG
jgi:hypothetical protein